jgi:hypothetical protein
MPTDLAPIPVQLWDWGISNRTGVLRTVDRELSEINLLPHENAKVSVLGICFKGLYYTCTEAVSLGWFNKNKSSSRPAKISIAYDPLDTNIIYVRPDHKFNSKWRCALQSRSRRYANMSFTEALSIQLESKQTIASAQQEADYKAPDVQKELEKIVALAEARKNDATLSNKSKRLKGIEANRAKEKNLERQKKRDIEISRSMKENKATVTSIHAAISNEDTFDYPDLDDF